MQLVDTNKTRIANQAKAFYKILTIVATLLTLMLNPSFAKSQETLSLQDVIHLSLRENPNVQILKLNERVQRMSVETAKWRFKPHFAFGANANDDRVALTPEASLLTKFGTDIKVKPHDLHSRHPKGHLSVTVVQPLLRGFGQAVVEAALYDALDQEKIFKLNIEGTIRTTITNVINAYLDLVAAEKRIEIDEEALKRAQESVKQTALFIKSGRKAGNEIITVKANVAQAQASLENNKNALSQVRYALLMTIGLDPNQDIDFADLDIHKLIKKYQLVNGDTVKELALDHDVQYQTDLITINGVTKRSVMLAEDNARPILNLELSHRREADASLSLTIPIDDQAAKQQILVTKTALQQAHINLKTSKWNKEVAAVNNWKTVLASKRSLTFADDAAKLQDKTYQMSYQKYLHGLIDSLELQTAQFQLIQSQHSLLAAQISYLKSLVQLDMLVGHTLKTWDIEARLG